MDDWKRAILFAVLLQLVSAQLPYLGDSPSFTQEHDLEDLDADYKVARSIYNDYTNDNSEPFGLALGTIGSDHPRSQDSDVEGTDYSPTRRERSPGNGPLKQPRNYNRIKRPPNLELGTEGSDHPPSQVSDVQGTDTDYPPTRRERSPGNGPFKQPRNYNRIKRSSNVGNGKFVPRGDLQGYGVGRGVTGYGGSYSPHDMGQVYNPSGGNVRFGQQGVLGVGGGNKPYKSGGGYYAGVWYPAPVPRDYKNWNGRPQNTEQNPAVNHLDYTNELLQSTGGGKVFLERNRS